MIKNTREIHVNGVKMLIYGESGAGKTSLIKTMTNPLVISAESGLLSLAGEDIPYISISSMQDLSEAYKFLTESNEAAQFKSLAIDSISEIAEVCLSYEIKKTKDPRQAYGAMQDVVFDLIRSFRDISGKHIYMTAKLDKATDEMGRMLYSPSLPGKKTAQMLPYYFDEVFALRIEKDQENKYHRGLMCDSDGLWLAKDRSGKLDQWEAPDIGEIINKITGG